MSRRTMANSKFLGRMTNDEYRAFQEECNRNTYFKRAVGDLSQNRRLTKEEYAEMLEEVVASRKKGDQKNGKQK